MVDEAHAHRRARPRRPRLGRRRRPRAARSTWSIGTLGKALGCYGAYVCASRELTELPGQHRPPLHLLHRPAAPGRRRRPGGAGAARSAARAGRAAAPPTRRRCARRSPPRASRWAARGPRSCPVEVGDAEPTMALCERVLERGVFAQGDPPADRARGHLAPALHGDGDPPPRRAGARRASWSAPRRASSAIGADRPRQPQHARSPPEPLRGVFVTGTGTEVGKTVVAAVIARTLAADRDARSRSSSRP